MKEKEFIKRLTEFITSETMGNKCPGCQEEMEKLNGLIKEYQPFTITFRPDYNGLEGWHIELNEE